MGLIAGNGPLPSLFAREASARGIPLVVVGHIGETQRDLEGLVEKMNWIHVGELEAMILALRDGGAREAVMLGGIDKRRALKNIRLDERAQRVIKRLIARGDDTLLAALASEMEEEGIQVLSSRDLMASWLAPAGVLTSRPPTPREEADLRVGIGVLARLGTLDIGQTVLVKEGVILAVEAIEGTDQAILRGGALGGAGAVVIKGSKPQQDMRFDVPVVGSDTMRTMEAAGAGALALEAGGTILLDREEMVRIAEGAGICIVGWTREDGHA